MDRRGSRGGAATRWLSYATVLVVAMAIASVVLPATPAVAATRAPWSWLAMYSEGDYIGAGRNQLFQQSSSTPIDASGSPAGLGISVGGPTGVSLGFAPIQGDALGVGYYSDAQRASFRAAGHPGIDITSGSAGCNSDTGEFTVEDIAFVNGIVSRLAITFIQHCDGGTAALFGEVRYNEPTSDPLVIQASSLELPAKYIGIANISVPLWVTNPSTMPTPVGPVTTSGADPGDVAVTADSCPPVLGPAATCVITATVTPQGSGVRQSVINVASGSSSVSVAVTDTGIAGDSAFVLDSSASYEIIGSGKLLNYNQFNSDIEGGRTTGTIDLSAYVDSQLWYEATFAPPLGQDLAVGDYPNTQLNATASNPGFGISGDVDGESHTCDGMTGQFTIREIAFDRDGNLSHFAADAHAQCRVGGPDFFASFRLASSIGYSAVAVQPPPVDGALIFPTRVEGRASPAQQVSVTNAGDLPLSVSPAIAGTNASDFQVSSSSCAAESPLAPGATCSSSVTFTPQGVGPRSASLVLTDGTQRGQHLVGLTGTGVTSPMFTYPVNQQWGVDTTKPFTWSTSPGVEANRLVVGTSPGAADLVDSGVLPAAQMSFDVPALPTGLALYATASAEVNQVWYSQTVTFTVMAQVAAFTYPLQAIFNADPKQPITWTANSQDQGYYLVVGTTPGSANLINSGVLPPNQSWYNAPPMPANMLLYATIFTEWYGGWNYFQSISFAYQAGQATFTSPVNGQLVVDMAAPITWSTVPQAQAFTSSSARRRAAPT